MLKDRSAIITGSARGIGLAIAEILAKNGANLSLCDIDEGAVKLAAEKICQNFGVRAHGAKADVSTTAECEKFVEETAKQFGRIDILVNNAGITKDNLEVRMSES
ncbi:MAG: SDR family NAD(P)-dependent oxidoreductase, partial [Elusimicrobia bacterium]|nr:SDR family NAD(P)-dependent oxidoreductase [Elusimicrobiota bacterium]